MIGTRRYTAKDAEAFLTLYRACLEHYHVGRASLEDEAKIIALLNQDRHMACLLAFEGDVAMGFATWALTFPAGSGTALYMKELFVPESARGRGVGRALMSGLIRMAQTEGCVRVDWQTDGPNKAAQHFYARMGAPRYEKITYRINQTDYDTFLAALDPA
ncbi:MAG: GNAT family N-acetyltransferase [Pseudomonadota bacterium]